MLSMYCLIRCFKCCPKCFRILSDLWEVAGLAAAVEALDIHLSVLKDMMIVSSGAMEIELRGLAFDAITLRSIMTT